MPAKKTAPKKAPAKAAAGKKAATKKSPAGRKPDKDMIGKTLESRARRISEKDIQKLLDRKDELSVKLEGVPGKFRKMINQARLLYEMIRDYWNGDYREIPWYTVAMAAASLLYFLSPIDLIPDYIPVIGSLDDYAVMVFCYKAIEGDLRYYCEFKGYDPEQYF